MSLLQLHLSELKSTFFLSEQVNCDVKITENAPDRYANGLSCIG